MENNLQFIEAIENTTDRFEALLLERSYFETRVYDYLVSPFLFIPEDFWEPVRVGLTPEQISEFKELQEIDTCIICTESFSSFCELVCCKNKLCKSCADTWFCDSVKCPFCVRDLREKS